MNLLLLHAHDLGKHLGCHGNPTVSSPNLDHLARTGAVFHRHFCSSPGCSPSRAALWTGRYPHRTGVHGLTHHRFFWTMDPGERHLAGILRNHGYHTALAGGYHESRDHPGELGYDRWLNDDGFLGFESARKVADASVEFLEGRSGEKKPFFLSVGLFEPHRPFDFGGVEPDRANGVDYPDWVPDSDGPRKEAADAEFAAIQGAIREMDRQVGRILDSLEANGLAEDTVVLFTSDHGLAVPRAKCSLYDPGIEITLLLRHPGEPTWRGIEREGPCSNVDVAPTILDLLGIRGEDDGMDGRSLRPLLDRDHVFREEIYAEKTYHRDYDPIRCLRTPAHKLIVNFEHNVAYDAPSDIQRSPLFFASVDEYTKPRDPVELYDLRSDPFERHNLAEDPGHAELRDGMLARLRGVMEETSDPLLEGPIPSRYDPWIREATGFRP